VGGLLLALAGGCASTRQARQGDTYVAKKRLCRELIAREDWTAAFFYADELHRQDPKDPEVLVLRGTIYRERGLPGEAQSDLEEAVALDEGQAEAHAALGILLDTSGRGAEGEKQHQRAIALTPNNPAFLNNLGFSLFLQGKTDQAIEVYHRAVRLAPTSPRIRTNLGFAYAKAGDMARAAREFDMGGTPAEAKNNLGFAYERRGDLKNAFDLYLEALRLNPKSERVKANLGYVAKKLGREIPEDVSANAEKDPSP
jgi:Flp pilus assembly protein TadD